MMERSAPDTLPMTPDQELLAWQLVALGSFWPVLDSVPRLPVNLAGSSLRDDRGVLWVRCAISPVASVPFLTDPATKGVILGEIRRHYDDQRICCILDTGDGRWCCGIWDDGLAVRGRGGNTEEKALARTLIAIAGPKLHVLPSFCVSGAELRQLFGALPEQAEKPK